MLPLGARGFRFEGISVEERPDGKICLFLPRLPDGSEIHYTLHPGNASGVLDLHETRTFSDGARTHRTVLAIRLEDVGRVLEKAAPAMLALLSRIRSIRLGWLKRQGIGVYRGFLADPADLAQVTRLGTKKRLEFDLEKAAKRVIVPEFLEDIYDLPDGLLTLMKDGRIYGHAFKLTDAQGRGRLLWGGRNGNYRREQRRLLDALEARLLACAVPADEHARSLASLADTKTDPGSPHRRP